MKAQRKAQIATAVLLAGTLALVTAKRGAGHSPITISTSSGATAQGAIYRMMDAARDGDVRTYLACFTGPMETSLRQILKEKGENSLADYIRRFNTSVKGLALQEMPASGDRDARVRVEFIYADRNESQVYELRAMSGEWRIAQATDVQGVKIAVPYGTKVE